ncbi:hypothetical protein ACIHAR_03645 [Streptomyces sp. NPDC052016]|jgi:hypothetical protein|uniref:hypothetical protein n=1 Tax=unclassified Streptomyces TaxID=2593676 RepID=UPI00343EA9B4
MSDRRRLRRLVVDDSTTYMWTIRHRHEDGTGCAEILTLHQDGVRTRIVFRSGEGRYAGGGYPTHSGGVGDRDHHLNLHEPGTVRAFVEEARRRGLLPHDGELDGWELFRAVAVSRAAATTPEVPRDRPPGP